MDLELVASMRVGISDDGYNISVIKEKRKEFFLR